MTFDEAIVIWWKFYAACAGIGGFSLGVLVTCVALTWNDQSKSR